MGICGYYLFKL